MLIQAAIGDAYGAGFEFRDAAFIQQHNTLEAYYAHGLFPEIQGRYTDDTQMAIAIAELLLEQSDWHEELVADKFVEVFHRDKRRGYSPRVYNALDASSNGRDFLKIIDKNSRGNGASMRAYPIGILPDKHQVLHFAAVQARASHNTTEGIIGAQRIALAAHYYHHDQEQGISLIDYLNETLCENEVYEVISPIDMHGFPTTKAVIRLVSDHTDLKNCLVAGVGYGGDTDTVASLCMALLSLKQGTEQNLPAFLYDGLETGVYGRDYLKRLDEKLYKPIFPATSPK